MRCEVSTITNILRTIVFSLLLVACKPTVPGEFIQPDDMEDILYDYYISQAVGGRASESNSVSFNKSLYYYAVLKKHGVTEAQFDSSMVYYYTHSERLYKIYKSVGDRLENEALGLGASVGEMGKYSMLTTDGDTANIWKGEQAAILMPVSPYDKLVFTIEGDSTFKKGDSFLFNFMTTFFYQSGTKDAVAYIAVRYDNDSISTHSTHVTVSGLSQLRIKGNDDNGIKDLRGFIYLNRGNDESRTQKVMFIDNIQFVRFHKLLSDSISLEKPDALKAVPDSAMKKNISDTTILNVRKEKRMLLKPGESGKG